MHCYILDFTYSSTGYIASTDWFKLVLNIVICFCLRAMLGVWLSLTWWISLKMTLNLFIESWPIDWHWSLILSVFFLTDLHELNDGPLNWFFLVSSQLSKLLGSLIPFISFKMLFSFHYTYLSILCIRIWLSL